MALLKNLSVSQVNRSNLVFVLLAGSTTFLGCAYGSNQILALLGAVWGAIFLIAGFDLFSDKVKRKIVKHHYWKAIGVAVFSGFGVASLLVPLDAFAQATDVSGKCSTLGFLTSLGTLTTRTFSGLSNGSGSDTDLSSRVCGLILLLVWALCFAIVAAALATAINMYSAGRGGGMWSEAGNNLAIPAFIVLMTLTAFEILGISSIIGGSVG